MSCFAPDEKHWNGATPTMGHDPHSHPGEKDGKVVEWMEMSELNNIVSDS
jgi:hypothetical protein